MFMEKLYNDQNLPSLGKLLIYFNLLIMSCLYFSKGVHSHVSFLCLFSISRIVPLIASLDLRDKNIFRKLIT